MYVIEYPIVLLETKPLKRCSLVKIPKPTTHIPKEKRSKLDSSGKQRIFVGFSEQSKAYRIYIIGFHQINISRDVTIDEYTTFTKSKNIYEDKDQEEKQEAPRTTEATKPPVRDVKENPIPKNHGMEKPQGPMETPHEMNSTK